MTKIDEAIDNIIEDMWERPFARTWEWEERNMRKILKKHLTSLQEPTERVVEISDNLEAWYKTSCPYCEYEEIHTTSNYCPWCWAKIKWID